MNSTIAICAIISWITIAITSVICSPSILSDNNAFLKGFVNHEFLGFMGVLVTITLASATNLFIELNRREKEAGKAAFPKTKRSVKESAYWLIAFLALSVVVVVVKPLMITSQGQAVANGIAITIILMSIMMLIDLTQTAFKLGSGFD